MAYQDKLKPIATTTPSYAAKLKPVPKQDGIVSSIVKGVAKPFARLAGNVQNIGLGIKSLGQIFNQSAYDATKTEIRRNNTEGIANPVLGNIKPVGASGNFGRDVADSIGVGAEIASTVVPFGRAPSIVKNTIGGRILQGVGTGASTGAKAGALYGGGTALQDPNATPASVGLNTLVGGASGAIGGGVLGGALAVPAAVGRGSSAIINRNKPEAIVNRRVSELTRLEDNNAPVRRVLEKHTQRGIDSKKILAQTDLLHGAVDDTGTLRTQNAIAELNNFIRPHEDVISANLAREGVTLPVEVVASKLRRAVGSSGLQGAAYTRALKSAEDDLAGYLARIDNDRIPLSLLHDAKVDKYANINYLNPETKRADKAIAKALKELVEEHTKSVDVKALNGELSQHFSVLDLLEKLDGKKVDGGKLGKYFAQTIGSIVGSHFGPLGTIAGAELGGRVQGSVLAGKMSGKTGLGLQRSDAMNRAVQQGKAPLLGLPAPKPGTPKVQNNVPIPMGPASSMERQAPVIGYENSLGSRQSSQATTKAPITNTMPGSIPPSGKATLGALLGGGAAATGVAAATTRPEYTPEQRVALNDAIKDMERVDVSGAAGIAKATPKIAKALANIHPDDLHLMEGFIDYVRVGKKFSDTQFDEVEKLAQHFGISMDKGLAGVANIFDKVLKGVKNDIPDTVVQTRDKLGRFLGSK